MSSLSSEQLAAVRLIATGKSQQEAAQALGVAKRTVQRWAKIPEFATAVADARNMALEATVEATAGDLKANIERLIPKAIAVLEATLDDGEARGADRLRAADIVGKWAGLYQAKLLPDQQGNAEQNLKGYLAYLETTNGNGSQHQPVRQ